MDKYIGRLLDNRYEILEVIGTGGMAVVYKARCHRLNRLVAIKILKDDYLEDEEFRRRFHAESQAVAMLGHPNIVSVYDVSTSDEADYIVMELIDGISLKQYMEKKGILNWKETLHFAIQIAKALEHAHSRGIVHRDIKPHNVMVLKNGSVKVADFGIARMMSKGNTLTKEALGSVHYISPEQAKGGRVDNRSDIYSLGVVMYEMMSGRPPYDGESPVAVAIQHINGGAVMPSTLNPNTPGGLEQIIMKAMALSVDERYFSATAMLSDMDEFRKNPAILFDYNTPPLDEVTKIQRPPVVLEAPAVRSAAERAERRAEGRPQRTSDTAAPRRSSASGHSGSPHRRRAEVEESRSHVATIAIISCSLVMIIAIVIFMIVLFNGGMINKDSDLVSVPNLVGKVYANLPEIDNFQIKLASEVYDDTVPAGQIISQLPEAYDKVSKGKTIYLSVSKGPEPVVIKMENVVGKTKAEADQILKNIGVQLQVSYEEEYNETVPAGTVIRTDTEVGTTLADGQKVKVWVSLGPEIKTAIMPKVVESASDKAVKTLENQDLDLTIRILEVYNSVIPEGYVVRSEPAAGEDLKTGQEVKLYVSKGPELATMPNVLGMDVDKAQNVLQARGFDVNNIQLEYVESEKAKDTVVSQSVEADTQYDIAREIVLEISTGPSQDTTGPSEATKVVSLKLPDDYLGQYTLTIKQGDRVIGDPITVLADARELEIQLTGSGVQYYDIYINEQLAWTERVDFNAQ